MPISRSRLAPAAGLTLALAAAWHGPAEAGAQEPGAPQAGARERPAQEGLPPGVTRLVLELPGSASYRIEEGATPGEIRIIVESDPPAAGPAPGREPEPALAPAPADEPYAALLAGASRTLAWLFDLLARQAETRAAPRPEAGPAG